MWAPSRKPGGLHLEAVCERKVSEENVLTENVCLFTFLQVLPCCQVHLQVCLQAHLQVHLQDLMLGLGDIIGQSMSEFATVHVTN